MAFEDLIAAHEPMARIERPEDDVYMLYTGGTTGMPKGVMYTAGGITQGFITLGYPLLALEPPTDVAAVGALVKAAHEAGNTARLHPRLPAHARHRDVARHDDPAPRGRARHHAREPIASIPTSCCRWPA